MLSLAQRVPTKKRGKNAKDEEGERSSITENDYRDELRVRSSSSSSE